MNVIIANYGNESMALLQWAKNNELQNVFVVYVDTGWAAKAWASRVALAEKYVKKLGFTAINLSSVISFRDLILNRQEFPTQKFQWCAGTLKGLSILDWLDQNDMECTATIILSTRRSLSRITANIAEYIEESEHYGERKVWHPLFQHDIAQRDELIQKTGFEILPHRSLECDPCVNSNLRDFTRLNPTDIEKVIELEKDVAKPMFISPATYNPETFDIVIKHAKELIPTSPQKPDDTIFEMGCGAPYVCGQ